MMNIFDVRFSLELVLLRVYVVFDWLFFVDYFFYVDFEYICIEFKLRNVDSNVYRM